MEWNTKTESPGALPGHKTSDMHHGYRRVLVKIITVDNDLNERRVVFDVGVVLCVKRRQRHQQRTAAGNVHLGRRTFKRRARWIRSECVDNVFTTVLINEHQSYLQDSNTRSKLPQHRSLQ